MLSVGYTMNKTSKRLFIIGAVLVVLGFLIPLLMIIDFIPKDMLLLQMAVALMQIFGMMAGIIGSALHVKVKRDEKDRYY